MNYPYSVADIASLKSIDFADWANSNLSGTISTQNLSSHLRALDHPFYLITDQNNPYSSNQGALSIPDHPSKLVAFCSSLKPEDLGEQSFKKTYGVNYALYGGSMANGISSEDFVIALGNSGFMGSFGAGGCLPARMEKAINIIKEALPDKPFSFNLLNSPFEPALEARTTELYLRFGIRTIEASAYLNLTSNLVWYRASGLSQFPDGSIKIANRIIAKVSRKEVASKFLQPADPRIVSQLVEDGKLNQDQARLSQLVPMADDITVEADSGGHTDNRPLVSILPAMIALRDVLQAKYNFHQPVRIGAAGGIATPASALAAFIMGAAYVVTGSVNQGCVESGASEHTRKLLAQMDVTDVAMAPASDMFEMGVKVQVLKRGTMFAMRAQKLFEIYQRYESIDEIPPLEKEKLESTIFKQNLNSIWEECIQFFSERDPKQIERALQKPKDKMALIFRWYLGLSSRWSMTGEKGREMDYQIWCGPSMGAFNDWVKGTYLENPENRKVVDVSLQILSGAAYLYRVRMLEAQGIYLAPDLQAFVPTAD
ncbi:MAG: PfaD family polyunsaturated fatty acid/polyketide biosynthesis protein [Chloroflexi bacterium]|nr:PfaD family polyunsaturated fatty acid/polyketide biosynthesis protein [Chloroflexota bacterium]